MAMASRKKPKKQPCECEICVLLPQRPPNEVMVQCICTNFVISFHCQEHGRLCVDCRIKNPLHNKKVKLVGFRPLELTCVERKIQENFGSIGSENDFDIVMCKTQNQVEQQWQQLLPSRVFLWEDDKFRKIQPQIQRILSDYEQLRESNIQRNQQFCTTILLGSENTKDVPKPPKNAKKAATTIQDGQTRKDPNTRRSRRSASSLFGAKPRWTMQCPFGNCLPIVCSEGVHPISSMQSHFNRAGCAKDVMALIAPERIDTYFAYLEDAIKTSDELNESACEIKYPEFENYARCLPEKHRFDDSVWDENGADVATETQQVLADADQNSGSNDLQTRFLQTVLKVVDFPTSEIDFDYQIPDPDADDEYVLPAFCPLTKPSEEVFLLQQRLMYEYAVTNNPVKARKKRRTRDGNGEISTEDETSAVINPDNIVRFYDHCVRHNVRGEEARSLLKLIHDMGTACHSVIPMPTTFTSIQDSCGKRIPKLFQIQRIDVMLQPRAIFSRHKDELTPTRGVSMCILEVLAKALLEIKPSSFITEPDEQTTLLTDFTTGSYFTAMCSALKDEFGPKAKPLLISVTLDKTTLNSARTQSACPVLFYIMNAVGKSFKPIFLGYAPVELAYDEEHLAAILGEIGVNVDKVHQTLFKIAKRRAMSDFLFHILSPILQFQQTGMHVAIGQQGLGQKEEVVFPHYSHFHGDNEQQDSLLQVSNRGLRHQCRGCNQDQCGGLDNCYPCVGTVRSDRLNAFLSEAGERLHVELTDSLIRGLGTPKWSENKRKVLDATCFWNIKPGFNRLYDLIKWQSIRGLNSLHQMFPADFLHTFLKGLIENLISWCLIIIEAIGEIDKFYASAAIDLDKTIKKFPIHELPVVRMVKFSRGLRYCLKLTTLTKKLHSGTNFLSGGFEAWKLASMMVQLLFSVGSSGTYCPNDPGWYDSTLLPFLNKGLEEGKKHTAISTLLFGKSVNQVIVNAMCSALQCLFCLKSGSFSDIQLDTVNLLLKNARVHHARVFKLKFLVCAALNLKTRDFEEEKQFAGTKIHHLMHFVTNMKRLGGTTRSWDTEMSEQMHKVVGKAAYEASSKTKKGMLEEMVRYVQKRDHAQALLMRVVKCTGGSTYSENLSFEDSDLDDIDPATFEHASNNSIQLIKMQGAKNCIERLVTGVAKQDSRKLFLHGLIQLPDILLVLKRFVRDSLPTDMNISKFLSGVMPIAHLVTNLKWKSSTSEHVLLRANPEFKNDPREVNTQKFPVFSSINYKVNGSNEKTAKIMAIIEFSSQSFYLIVLPYKERCIRRGETNFYGCDNLSYSTKARVLDLEVVPSARVLDFEVVPSHNVTSQAFVCPNIDTQKYRCKETEFDTKWRFLSIPYLQARPALQVDKTYSSYSRSFPDIFQCETDMMVRQSFATVGSRVLCNQYDMGLWLEGKITGMCGKGDTFEILFDFSPVPEDKRERNVPLSRLQFNVKGGRACWRDTSQVWSMGTICSVFTASVTILSDNGIKKDVIVNRNILFIGQRVDALIAGHWRSDCSIVKFNNPDCCVICTIEGVESTVTMNNLRVAVLREREDVPLWKFIVDQRCYASFQMSKGFYPGNVSGRALVGGAYHVSFDDGDKDVVPPGMVDFRLPGVKVVAKVQMKQASAEASAKNEWMYGTISEVDWENDTFLVEFLPPQAQLKVTLERMVFIGKIVRFDHQTWVIRKLHCRRGLCDIIHCVTNEIRERIAPAKLILSPV